MQERKRFWKAGCIGPSMVLLGVMMSVMGLFTSFVVAVLSMKPGQTSPNFAQGNFWNYVGAAGLYLIAAGLFVMLFQGVLWLVRRAGVAKSQE